jgi:hypothetical protein
MSRRPRKRPTFGLLDHLKFVGLYRLTPKELGALAIAKPEIVIKQREGDLFPQVFERVVEVMHCGRSGWW